MLEENRLSQERYENSARLILRLRSLGVQDTAIFSALELVPRQNFVPSFYGDIAYENGVIPIDCGQYIESFDEQMLLLDKLAINKKHSILEIGTGSGFTAAIMSHLADRVTSIDRYKSLVDSANCKLKMLNLANVVIYQADALAKIDFGSFDRIIIWGSFRELPINFLISLADKGRMIVAIGDDYGSQKATLYHKDGSNYISSVLCNVRYLPLQSGKAKVL